MRKLSFLFSILTSLTLVQNEVSAQNYTIAGADITDCSGNFYDSGGNGGTYSNSEYNVITICPDVAGAQVVLNFTMFNVEANYDWLCIYNGTSTASPSLGCYDNDVPLSGLVQGSNPSGCLTLEFDSVAVSPAATWTGPPLSA